MQLRLKPQQRVSQRGRGAPLGIGPRRHAKGRTRHAMCRFHGRIPASGAPAPRSTGPQHRRHRTLAQPDEYPTTEGPDEFSPACRNVEPGPSGDATVKARVRTRNTGTLHPAPGSPPGKRRLEPAPPRGRTAPAPPDVRSGLGGRSLGRAGALGGCVQKRQPERSTAAPANGRAANESQPSSYMSSSPSCPRRKSSRSRIRYLCRASLGNSALDEAETSHMGVKRNGPGFSKATVTDSSA